MRRAIPILILLAACAPQIPDSTPEGRVARGEGVGFGNYRDYQQAQAAERARREAALRGAPVTAAPGAAAPGPAPTPIVEPAPGTPGAAGLDPSIAAAVDAVQPGAPAGGTGAIRPPAATTALAPPAPVAERLIATGPRGLSDEQSFDAVSGRESIASDARRIAENRAAFEVAQPTAVPARPASTGPNLAEYALSTTNAVGQPVHRRSGVFAASRQERNCARYASADRAQAAFLANGGPDRDREGLDPDGDGFACAWSPAPYRAAVGR
ncbi:MAG: hypothetical protein ACU0BS_04150 [Hasllibacter sp.]